MEFLENYDAAPKTDFDNPRNGMTMDEKLSICAEITRLQKEITRIEAMPHGKIDDDCGDFEIKVVSRFHAQSSTHLINGTSKTPRKWKALH